MRWQEQPAVHLRSHSMPTFCPVVSTSRGRLKPPCRSKEAGAVIGEAWQAARCCHAPAAGSSSTPELGGHHRRQGPVLQCKLCCWAGWERAPQQRSRPSAQQPSGLRAGGAYPAVHELPCPAGALHFDGADVVVLLALAGVKALQGGARGGISAVLAGRQAGRGLCRCLRRPAASCTLCRRGCAV